MAGTRAQAIWWSIVRQRLAAGWCGSGRDASGRCQRPPGEPPHLGLEAGLGVAGRRAGDSGQQDGVLGGVRLAGRCGPAGGGMGLLRSAGIRPARVVSPHPPGPGINGTCGLRARFTAGGRGGRPSGDVLGGHAVLVQVQPGLLAGSRPDSRGPAEAAGPLRRCFRAAGRVKPSRPGARRGGPDPGPDADMTSPACTRPGGWRDGPAPLWVQPLSTGGTGTGGGSDGPGVFSPDLGRYTGRSGPRFAPVLYSCHGRRLALRGEATA